MTGFFHAADTGAEVSLSGGNLAYVVVVGLIALAALAMAFLFRREVLSASEGTEGMREIATAVQEGAAAYLNRADTGTSTVHRTPRCSTRGTPPARHPVVRPRSPRFVRSAGPRPSWPGRGTSPWTAPASTARSDRPATAPSPGRTWTCARVGRSAGTRSSSGSWPHAARRAKRRRPVR